MSSILGIFVKPRFAESSKIPREGGSCCQGIRAIPQAGDVGTASALCFQATAGKQDIMQIPEELIMIQHPVESCGAYDRVKNALERQMKQVASEQMQSASEVRCKVSARGAQHILRKVDGDDTSLGQGFQQFGGEEAGAATGVEDPFVSSEFQAGQDLFAPTDLGRREAMVDLGVPLALCGSVAYRILRHGFARIATD